MLTPTQLALREGRITASFAPPLMAGDAAAIDNKWKELIGDPTFKPESLDDEWPVQFGSFIEPFAIDWHERKHQHALTRRGEVVIHPNRNFVSATLDAYRASDQTAIEVKACGAWRSLDEITAYYTPQCIVQRACIGCPYVSLLIVHGSAEPIEIPIHIDADYEATLWQRVDQFWDCVQNLRPPIVFPPLVPPEQWKTIDLDRDETKPNWAPDMIEQLQQWDSTRDAAKGNEAAREEIKTLLPDDVGKLIFSGLVVSRARNRAVTIKRARTSR